VARRCPTSRVASRLPRGALMIVARRRTDKARFTVILRHGSGNEPPAVTALKDGALCLPLDSGEDPGECLRRGHLVSSLREWRKSMSAKTPQGAARGINSLCPRGALISRRMRRRIRTARAARRVPKMVCFASSRGPSDHVPDGVAGRLPRCEKLCCAVCRKIGITQGGSFRRRPGERDPEMERLILPGRKTTLRRQDRPPPQEPVGSFCLFLTGPMRQRGGPRM